ncbi:hypothetical protein M0804_013803 [Polistes exclamans]|nr:hypothetical protein M0804_013803 [Polistes exclamans]
MNISPMSCDLYKRYEREIGSAIEKVAKWAAVLYTEVINRVVNFEICLDNGKIKPRSDSVWTDICEIWKMPSGKYLKTPIALYFDMTQNRNNIFDRYLKERGLNFPNTDEDKDIFYPESDESSESVETEEKHISFNITFTKEEWLKIKPIEKIKYNNTKYYASKKGWTTIVSNLIYVTQKLPCAFKFSRQSVIYLNNENNIDKYILKIEGSCTEKVCHADIVGECIFNFNDDENVSMLIHTANTFKIPHFKKRHITGEQRHQFANELELQKGEQFKRKLIETYQQYGDVAAPIIPNVPVLNKIRHERKKNRLGIQENLFDSLKHLKHNNLEFADVIKQVGYDKFFIMYWTHQQIDLYNDLIKLNPIVSIDATGGVVRKIPFAEYCHQGPIFLYQIVTHIDHLIIPICQMLSERHDTNILTFWLFEWISSKARIPLDVVTNMSADLQNSICLAFCNLTYKQYLSNCFQFLMKKSKTLPQLYIRIDIAHLIHSVSTHKCFLFKKFKIKDFYLRAIGLMSTLENLSDVEKMIKALLNISQNKYGCKNDIQWVLKQFKTFSFDDTASDYKKVIKRSSCDNKFLCYTHLFCHDEDLEDDYSAAIKGRAAYDKQQMIKKELHNTKKVIGNSVLNYEENWKNKNELNKTVELNITEDMFSEISVNEVEEKLKKFRNNANESGTLHKLESSKEIILSNDIKFHSTPQLFPNVSYKHNQENSYSIVIDEQLTPFKIWESKTPPKCKEISETLIRASQ